MGKPIITFQLDGNEIKISELKVHYAGSGSGENSTHKYEVHFTSSKKLSKKEMRTALNAMVDIASTMGSE